ncbi:hypothetical protein G7Y89_g12450 [Cudoniella acicularis]|uniref:Uncharacterized protein n=1 Tax=Cudoniella acicularis TaxID=354080 RepID=A0A8H4RBI2_9HELO|nr:hypothetical protein G7Y89_g12450 [Cudoniella acicularis]
MPPNNPNLAFSPSHLSARMVPVPPSTYVSAGKLATTTIIIIVIVILLVTITLIAFCCCCCKRQRTRYRAKRIAKAAEREAGNRRLKPRIHGGNARFYAPGLRVERERSMESLEMGSLRSGKGGIVKAKEAIFAFPLSFEAAINMITSRYKAYLIAF